MNERSLYFDVNYLLIESGSVILYICILHHDRDNSLRRIHGHLSLTGLGVILCIE